MNFDSLWTLPASWDGLAVRKYAHAKTGFRMAVYSKDELHRYLLRITWDPLLPPYMLMGLNPSKATERKDDPTIRRCIGFGKQWGYGGLLMTNLAAFRATLPVDMFRADDPVGAHNTIPALVELAGRAGNRVVLAWGNNAAKLGDWSKELLAGFETAGVSMWTFGLNNDGSPKHPLYVPASVGLLKFNCNQEVANG